MPKPSQLKNHHTVNDIAKEVDRTSSTVRHYVNNGILPSPATRLTVVRFIGDFVNTYTISLWSNRQLNFLKSKAHLIKRGRYKQNLHPITKKKSKR